MPSKVQSFFRYDLWHINQLHKEKNYSAVAGVIACWILSLGLVPLVCRLAFYDKSFKRKSPQETSKTEKKTDDYFKETLRKTNGPSETPDTPLQADLLKPSIHEVIGTKISPPPETPNTSEVVPLKTPLPEVPDMSEKKSVPSLTEEEVLAHLNGGLFDRYGICTLTDDQLRDLDFAKVDVENIDREVFNRVIDSKTIRLLGTKYHDLTNLIPLVSSHHDLKYMLKAQVEKIDFRCEVITQNSFSTFVGKGEYKDPKVDKRAESPLQYLSPEQVVICLNRGLFDPETVSFLTDQQVKDLDFSQIDGDKLKNVATGLVDRFSFIEYSLDINPILCSSHDILKNMTEKQVQAIDFSNEAITQEWFNIFAGDGDVQDSPIRHLSDNQVIDCFKRRLFHKKIAGFLTEEQVSRLDLSQAFDPSKIDSQDVKDIINKIFLGDRIKLLRDFSHFTKFIVLLHPSNLRSLDPTQIRLIDFNDESITPEWFSKSFVCSVALWKTANLQSISQISLLRHLAAQQVATCINRSLFIEERIKVVTDNQWKELNLSQIDSEKLEDIFNIISNQFSLLISFIKQNPSHDLLKTIKKEQVQSFDFGKITQESFSTLAGSYPTIEEAREKSLVRLLSKNQVKYCLENDLFTINNIDYLTDEQVTNTSVKIGNKIISDGSEKRKLIKNNLIKIEREQELSMNFMNNKGTQDFITLLSKEDIIFCLNKKLFKESDIDDLTHVQIESIPLTKNNKIISDISEKRKAMKDFLKTPAKK